MFCFKTQWLREVRMETTGSIYSFYKYYISTHFNARPYHCDLTFNKQDLNSLHTKTTESYDKVLLIVFTYSYAE